MEGAATPQQEQKAESPRPKSLAIGIQFRPAGKVYTFSTTDPCIAAGEVVVVEAEGGTSMGTVASAPREMPEGEPQQALRRCLRRASPEEIDRDAKQRERALEYFSICQKKARAHNLPMKLVDAQIEEDGRKVVFIFYSEGRIDFRQLVKELAGQLHMRIEMRQVGARDEAKHRGCIGPCGQMTCCSLHLRGFQSISISMAKHQGLAPNPAKLTGMCGKLKCCLAYEHEVYNEYRQGLPKMGASVSTPEGPGKVVGHNVLKRECTVRLFGGGETRCACEKCAVLSQAEREAALEAARKAGEAGAERARMRREKRESRDQSRDAARERRGGRRDEQKKPFSEGGLPPADTDESSPSGEGEATDSPGDETGGTESES